MSFYNEWMRYRRNVVPANASKVQLEETKKAFYAGGLIIMNRLLNAADNNLTEDQAADMMDSYFKEVTTMCEKFAHTSQ